VAVVHTFSQVTREYRFEIAQGDYRHVFMSGQLLSFSLITLTGSGQSMPTAGSS
jgi:hypothetical protein